MGEGRRCTALAVEQVILQSKLFTGNQLLGTPNTGEAVCVIDLVASLHHEVILVEAGRTLGTFRGKQPVRQEEEKTFFVTSSPMALYPSCWSGPQGQRTPKSRCDSKHQTYNSSQSHGVTHRRERENRTVTGVKDRIPWS